MTMPRPIYKIKEPTIRKIKNKGFKPVTLYLMNYGYVSGWIYKTGRKWLYFYSYTTGNKRIPINTDMKVLL
jgi:hypothetical protein